MLPRTSYPALARTSRTSKGLFSVAKHCLWQPRAVSRVFGQVEIYSAAALLNQRRRTEKGSHGWPSALHTHTGAVRTPRPGRQRRFLATRSCHRTCSRREGSQKKIQLKLGTPPVEQPDIPHWTLWLTPTMHVTQLLAAAAPSAIRPLPPATPVVRRASSSLVITCVTTLRSTLTGLCRELRLVAMHNTDRPQYDDCCRGRHTQPWHRLAGPRRDSFPSPITACGNHTL